MSGQTDIPSPPEKVFPAQTDLASVVVDDEALVPAVEVFMCVDLHSELLQHGLVRSLAHRVHGGTHIVQDAHDARGTLGSQGEYFTLVSTLALKLTNKQQAWILYFAMLFIC